MASRKREIAVIAFMVGQNREHCDRRARLGSLMLLLWLVLGPWGMKDVASQTPQAGFEVSVDDQSWTIDLPGYEVGLDQTVFSTGFSYNPERWKNLSLRGYLPVAYSSLGRPEGDSEVRGVGDVQLRLLYRSTDRRWLLMGGFGLPTGHTALTVDEYRVASRVLPSRVLDFHLKRPGEGFDVSLTAGRSFPLGYSTALGVAVSGQIKGSYDVLEAGDGSLLRASPGEQLNLSAYLNVREHEEDPDWKLAASVGLQIASESELRQQDLVYKVDEGEQLILRSSYARRLGENKWLDLSLFHLQRGRNEPDLTLIPTFEILGIATRWMSGAEIGYRTAIAGLADVGFGVRHTLYRIDPASDNNSRVTSLDLDADRDLGEWTSLQLGFSYGFGYTRWYAEETGTLWQERDLSGLGIRLGLSVGTQR
jgi:hypothetical protein